MKDVDRLWSRRRIIRVAGQDRNRNRHREEVVVLDGVELGCHVRLFFRGRPNGWCVIRGEDLIVDTGDSDVFADKAGDHDLEHLEHGIVLRRSALRLVPVDGLPLIELVLGERME
jgi:hypothetical protein